MNIKSLKIVWTNENEIIDPLSLAHELTKINECNESLSKTLTKLIAYSSKAIESQESTITSEDLIFFSETLVEFFSILGNKDIKLSYSP